MRVAELDIISRCPSGLRESQSTFWPDAWWKRQCMYMMNLVVQEFFLM